MLEVEYSAFLHYQAVRDKYSYMQGFRADSNRSIALTIAVFGGFTEGVQLFASFARALELSTLQQDARHEPDRGPVGLRRDLANTAHHQALPGVCAKMTAGLGR